MTNVDGCNLPQIFRNSVFRVAARTGTMCGDRVRATFATTDAATFHMHTRRVLTCNWCLLFCSCLASDLDFEIVVVEDSSPDGTLAVAEMLQVGDPPPIPLSCTAFWAEYGVYALGTGGAVKNFRCFGLMPRLSHVTTFSSR